MSTEVDEKVEGREDKERALGTPPAAGTTDTRAVSADDIRA